MTATEVSAVQQDKDEETLIDLNPKKNKKRDNIFMDFMALYSRATIDDKSRGNSAQSKIQL